MASTEDITTNTLEDRNGNTTKPEQIRDIFFFPHVRTASHVFCRLLSNQPGWAPQSDYHFKRAFDFARESFNWGPLTNVSGHIRKEFEGLLQEGFDEILRDRRAAKNEGKNLLLKEHTLYTWEPSKLSQSMWGGPMSPSFTAIDEGSPSDNSEKTNPTIFPDSFLKSWKPVFLIRHPAPTFESWYRAEGGARHIDLSDKSWSFFTSFQYSRELYDWFLSNSTEESLLPIVIDADDMLDKSSTMKRLCRKLGMDPQHMPDKWDTIPAPENVGCRESKFMGDYWNSTSIDSSKSSRGLDMDAKYMTWKAEFGLDAARELLAIVEKAMPDYNYLKSKKL
ncbi:hypothetical protein IFR05_010573 [Cadophora sp. M221]|nr:hypothetical protein IFR05_010573 [Cadophora sp. M221]